MPFSVALGVLLSGGSVIDLDGTVFVQLVIFAIAFFLLRALVFKPVMAVFDAREQAIDGEKANARKMEEDAVAKRDQFEVEIRKVRERANEEREKMRAEGQKVAREAAEKAREQSEKLLAESRQKLDAESARVRGEVKAVIPNLARQIAGKLLEREVQ
jgi:F-type H+-transporting ATPase subunit b